VWYSVSDVRINPTDCAALAKSFGLKAPKQKASADAFRVATSTFQHRDGTHRYLMRPVVDTPRVIIRDMVLEVVDEHGQTLSHEVVGRIRLDRGTKGAPDRVSIQKVTDGVANGLLRQAEAEYEALRNNLSGKDITRWVLKRMKEMATLTVHPNGRVYFVPASKADRLNAIRGFLNGLKPYQTGSHPMTFGMAPLPDTPDERAMVVNGFSDEASTRVQEVVSEIAEVLSEAGEEGLAPRVVRTRINRIQEVRDFVDGYKAFLAEAVPTLSSSMELLEAQAVALLDAQRDED
jgi:hypothetical protein